MDIKVLERACCGGKKLQSIVEETVKELGIMRTPALIIDDKVVVQGRVPKKDEIKKLFQK